MTERNVSSSPLCRERVFTKSNTEVRVAQMMLRRAAKRLSGYHEAARWVNAHAAALSAIDVILLRQAERSLDEIERRMKP